MIPRSFDMATLLDAYRDGADPRAVLAEVFRRLDTAEDPGIFLARTPPALLDRFVAELGPFDLARKPLWGIPFAIKDNIDLAGVPTTVGCPAFAFEPAASAEAVRRLIAAGALPIGKTNLDQFATGLVGLRTPYPVPRNAFDPAIVPGGSSSGSAVAVARGIVGFALGTDTAGSGRVPAGLNNLVGLKPSLGAVSVRGVFPACQTLDCVSIFALTVPDAWTVLQAMAGYDAADPWSRRIALGALAAPRPARIGIPDRGSRVFLGDVMAEDAFDAALALLREQGHTLVETDLSPFFAVAELLYEGAWVAERYQAVRALITDHPDAFHPTTLAITRGAERLSAADAFAGLYRLAGLRRQTEPVWDSNAMLAVPTFPRPVTAAEVEADPIGPNASLGTYTNFVNLLDLCALTLPGPFRRDGLPGGLTLVGPAGGDGMLASAGSAFVAAAGVSLGATGNKQPGFEPFSETPSGEVELAVVGAHLSGLPLNPQLVALRGRLVRTVVTTPDYVLYALPDTSPPKPGLQRVAVGMGRAIETEVWALSAESFGRFVAAVPAPLTIGTVQLADGSRPKGFLCEAAGLAGATDVSEHGGWRRYLAAVGAA